MTKSRMRSKIAITTGIALVAALAAVLPAAAQPGSLAEDLARWVNPYVGTKPGGADHGTGGGAGNTFPGADVPFGMVQWSPDTVTHQHGGYFYDDNRIKGFSLTHLSGAGCSTYQDVPIMPFVGEVTTSPAVDPNRYISRFSHANETVSAGRYGVALDSGARVDLSVTQRTGIGRFTFPAGGPATVSSRPPTGFRCPSPAPGGALQGGGFQVLVAEPGSLLAAFNNVGISPDDNMAVANFDLVGWSFSATALANAGVRPGGNVVVDGLSHVWPSVPVADPDNVIVGGQTVNLPAGPAGATRLALLGAAANGATSGDLVITYTDGSTQTERIGFSDWTVNGGGQPPSFDNRIVARMPYRNAVSGTPQQIATYVFATAPIALEAGKQVASVTLPSSVEGGALHVIAVTAG